MTKFEIPPEHPRAESLHVREKLIENFHKKVVAVAGLIAHGRGEAFDYLLGETTTRHASDAIRAAASSLLTAERPVISVNGNTAALVPDEVVQLAEIARAKIEVNLFYRSLERELAIKELLVKAGAQEILGIGLEASAKISELGSERRHVDPRGILAADVVMVPLEDGDRTEALANMDKKVIAIDLNPLSRTAQKATITIVDNVVRAMPRLVKAATELEGEKEVRREILLNFDNTRNLAQTITFIQQRLSSLAEKGRYLSLENESREF